MIIGNTKLIFGNNKSYTEVILFSYPDLSEFCSYSKPFSFLLPALYQLLNTFKTLLLFQYAWHIWGIIFMQLYIIVKYNARINCLRIKKKTILDSSSNCQYASVQQLSKLQKEDLVHKSKHNEQAIFHNFSNTFQYQFSLRSKNVVFFALYLVSSSHFFLNYYHLSIPLKCQHYIFSKYQGHRIRKLYILSIPSEEKFIFYS